MLHPRKTRSLWFVITALLLPVAAFAARESDIKHLQDRWAEINYQMEGKAQEAAFDALTNEANALVASDPAAPDLLIWSGIIKSTYAGAKGGLGALSLAKESKADLEKAMGINANALQGSVYTSLGALYYSVPGWPVGFGDDDKAEELLKQALVLNPDGIDSNYFYGSFLIEQKRFAEARTYLEKAQKSQPRSGRALADSGRQQEITAALSNIAGK